MGSILYTSYGRTWAYICIYRNLYHRENDINGTVYIRYTVLEKF